MLEKLYYFPIDWLILMNLLGNDDWTYCGGDPRQMRK